GEITAPDFLEVGWLLSQFGVATAKAQVAYSGFVQKEIMDSPWASMNGPDILGNDTFREQLQKKSDQIPTGISKRKALLRHLPLSDIAQTDRERSNWMLEAYREHGYTMQAIADFVDLHHSTVSRLIKMGEKNARNKS
ncbi:MAG: helix-turn-helix domain-containing protein, partial [Mariprofundaceae bacterium]